ncbi:hypothetical protein GIB67_022078 [Kingdonia uniflora]|uniref:Uncharacterized protein n=1 Tax=Kingdonia uniflora TaxID=39325 RepID=A0A7J7MU67_9MAGN|nr:hypothetical protein GIB67_022078 [Kingdonia uniflora]
MKLCLTRRVEQCKHHSQNDVASLMSVHIISLLFEAIYLKAKSLEMLRRYREAAQSCKVILDTIESTLLDCLLRNFGTDSKLQETLNKYVELLPELWKLSQSPQEAILSHRQALLHHWNLDTDIETRIQKEFAIFLLYSGSNATPPNLRLQVKGLFVPMNNIEEAVLLLMIMLRKSVQKRIKFDASVGDHLSYFLSVVGELRGFAGQIEEILPEDLDRDERYYSLALCYYGEGEDLVAFNLLKNMFSNSGNLNSVQPLLLASKVCGENSESAEGEKIIRKSQVLEALEIAKRAMRKTDPKVIFHLTLENAELRKLDVVFCYAKVFLRLQVESDVKGWVLLARILSGQKEFKDAEIVINNVLKEIGEWDQEFSCLIYWKVMTLPLTIPCAPNFCKPCLEDAFIRQNFVRERTCHGSRRPLRAQKNVMKCPSCPTDISGFLQNPQREQLTIRFEYERRLEAQRYNHTQVLESKLAEKDKAMKEQRETFQWQFDDEFNTTAPALEEATAGTITYEVADAAGSNLSAEDIGGVGAEKPIGGDGVATPV